VVQKFSEISIKNFTIKWYLIKWLFCNNEFLESEKTTSEKSKEENEKPKEKSDHVYLTLILVDSAKSHEFKISPKVNIFEPEFLRISGELIIKIFLVICNRNNSSCME